MNLYQNDDRIAKIFISGTKQVFWDRETWIMDMIVIQPCQCSMERNNSRDKRKSRIFCAVLPIFLVSVNCQIS